MSPAFVMVETTNESVCGGTMDSVKLNSLVSLHLHPYHKVCRNCVRIFELQFANKCGRKVFVVEMSLLPKERRSRNLEEFQA